VCVITYSLAPSPDCVEGTPKEGQASKHTMENSFDVMNQDEKKYKRSSQCVEGTLKEAHWGALSLQ